MFAQIPPITKKLIILNVIVFALAHFIPYLEQVFPAYFPLSPNFKMWQIITHMFMHGGFSHILFNMLTLWSFGPVLEHFLREKRFVILYFASGLGAFLLYNLWYGYEVYLLAETLQNKGIEIQEIAEKADLSRYPIGYHNFQDDTSMMLYASLVGRMVGASGAIFGIVAAFSTLFPNAKMMFMFIPFPIKAKYLFPMIMLGSLYFGFNDAGSNIAHFAHIGGAIVGFILAKIWGKKLNRFHIG